MKNKIKNLCINLKTKMSIIATSIMFALCGVSTVSADGGSGIDINISDFTSSLTSGDSTSGIDAAGSTITGVINTATGWLVALSAGVALIYGIVSAWRMMSAGGNPQKKESAKQSLFNVLIGCAIIGGLSLLVKVALGIFA